MTLYEKICEKFSCVVKTEKFVVALDATGVYLFAITSNNFDSVLLSASSLMKRFQLIPAKVVLCIVNREKEKFGGFYNLVFPSNLDDFIFNIKHKRSGMRVISDNEIEFLVREFENDRIKDSKYDLADEYTYDCSQTKLWRYLDNYREVKADKENLEKEDVIPEKLMNQLLELRPSTIEELQSLGVNRSILIDVLGMINSSEIEAPLLVDRDGNEYQMTDGGGIIHASADTDWGVYKYLICQIVFICVGVILRMISKVPWYVSVLFILFSFIWSSKFKLVSRKNYSVLFDVFAILLLALFMYMGIAPYWSSIIYPFVNNYFNII